MFISAAPMVTKLDTEPQTLAVQSMLTTVQVTSTTSEVMDQLDKLKTSLSEKLLMDTHTMVESTTTVVT